MWSEGTGKFRMHHEHLRGVQRVQDGSRGFQVGAGSVPRFFTRVQEGAAGVKRVLGAKGLRKVQQGSAGFIQEVQDGSGGEHTWVQEGHGGSQEG